MKPGTKYDDEKLRWDLLPINEVEDIVDILTFGAKKYEPDNWQKVSDPINRYYAALMRHLTAWRKGEITDQDSGKSHLSHAACCLLFLMWFDKKRFAKEISDMMKCQEKSHTGTEEYIDQSNKFLSVGGVKK